MFRKPIAIIIALLLIIITAILVVSTYQKHKLEKESMSFSKRKYAFL